MLRRVAAVVGALRRSLVPEPADDREETAADDGLPPSPNLSRYESGSVAQHRRGRASSMGGVVKNFDPVAFRQDPLSLRTSLKHA
jgi:hypothetical protein